MRLRRVDVLLRVGPEDLAGARFIDVATRLLEHARTLPAGAARDLRAS